MGRPPLDLTNQRFGRLVALKYVESRRWRCRCDCGRVITVWRAGLQDGSSQSCGCLQRELLSARKRTHGASYPKPSTEYVIWRGIKARCLNPKDPAWKHYGGRGITICARWRDSFESFLADMGPRPSTKHSIDRENNERGYEPSNCRWAVGMTQHGNTRTNRVLTFNGKSQHASAWARELGVPVYQINNRLRSKWSVERTLTEPMSRLQGRFRHKKTP